MKYKVVYKAKKKNAVRHIAWSGTLEECERIAAYLNKKLYDTRIEDYMGNVIKSCK